MKIRMKRVLALTMALSLVFALPVSAEGESNEIVDSQDTVKEVVLDEDSEEVSDVEDNAETVLGDPEGEGEEGEEEKGEEVTPLTGWQTIDGNKYYYDQEGNPVTGWLKISNVWYYFDGTDTEHPGIMLSNKTKLIDGAYYAFKENGAMATSWVKLPEGWYYANGNGSLKTGWFKSGSTWYYLDVNNSEYPCLMAENQVLNINGTYYAFKAGGAMATGWIQTAEGWYYANSNGSLKSGWLKSGGMWYYLNLASSATPYQMVADCTMTINGVEYSFASSGALRSGWVKEDGFWYYYSETGAYQYSGWNKIDGKWYYFDPDDGNKMLAGGWKLINGTYYYFYKGGSMAHGWLKSGGKWYYLGGASDGAMATGWKKISGYWYYFYKENDSYGGTYGAMAVNTAIEGYRISGDGRMMTSQMLSMYNRAQAYSSPTNYLLLIDTTNCWVGVYQGSKGHWNQVKIMRCSPGAAATPTVTGVFSVGSKGYYFDSGDLRLYWYTQFYGDYLFHSVCYLHDGSPADLRTGYHLSHGCVRLEISNAKWIYDNIPAGTTVVSY